MRSNSSSFRIRKISVNYLIGGEGIIFAAFYISFFGGKLAIINGRDVRGKSFSAATAKGEQHA